MPTLDRAGQRIHFDDHGGSGPAVLFCHSFGTNGGLFAAQLAALGDRYRCITWDQRAHGQSPAKDRFTFWDSADDALAILDVLGIEAAAIAGTSQGGFVAMRAALRAPARVRALAVLGTSAQAEPEATRASYTQLGEAFAAADEPPEAILDIMATICFGAEFDARPWKDVWRRWPGDQMVRALTALVERDSVAPRLPELATPLLVLHGTADNAYPLALAEEIAQKTPRCDGLVRVDGGAHFLNATHPHPVNAALTAFLARHL